MRGLPALVDGAHGAAVRRLRGDTNRGRAFLFANNLQPMRSGGLAVAAEPNRYERPEEPETPQTPPGPMDLELLAELGVPATLSSAGLRKACEAIAERTNGTPIYWPRYETLAREIFAAVGVKIT